MSNVKTPALDAYLREKAAEHNILLAKVRQLKAERDALLEAVKAFLECEGIPPTKPFQRAHRRALAAMRAVEPHCENHKQFEYDCIDCADALTASTDGSISLAKFRE